MKEVERKDLPGITGGQAGNTNVTIMPPIPAAPLPQPGPIDPMNPLGDGKPGHLEA